MADRSQYLVQALQGLQQPPAANPQGPDLAQLQKIADQRQAFEAANPGQSYMANGLQQMGQNIMQAPQALAQAPGNALSGFARLAQGMRPGAV